MSDQNLNHNPSDAQNNVNVQDPISAQAPANADTETLVKTPKPHAEQDTAKPFAATPPEIVYSDLRDEQTFATPVKPSDLPASQPLSESMLHNVSTEPLIPTPPNGATPTSFIPPQTPNAFIGDAPTDDERLVKTHKTESITDASILANSHQRAVGDSQKIVDARGTLIDHMDVTRKQWLLTAEWQRTNVNLSKFFGLRRTAQTLDLDLSCLLCNRYGEVLERVWFKNVRDQAEAVRYLGDELLGDAPPPDSRLDNALKDSERENLIPDHGSHQERMAILLPRIAPTVFQLVFVVASYGEYALAQAQNGRCLLADDEGNEIAAVDLTRLPDNCRALWLSTLSRSADSWRFREENLPLKIDKKTSIEQAVSQHLIRTAK